ncbi:hypothetical protein J2X85_001620 [Microbacterium trichothecenolyticum]|uniref:DUF3560 domain-containing protein n=1 Tax=Microbacterium trichothecenolyticum TaxID=69370 RepID=UPI0028666D2F|nr:DUF3560 domain-containing protein [Microbacterium trichothecenolyticum]MDR7184597.1 hypothetical protein [Microbacterium trichothecenolyticum]
MHSTSRSLTGTSCLHGKQHEGEEQDMLTITHTHEAGTLIEGTARGDGTAEILKANRWRWGRSIGSWYVPNSRDHRPDHHGIRRVVAALEAAGFEITTELDETVRSTAEVEADKIERQQARVAGLDAKAERRTADAEALWERHESDVNRLPEGGEPIKVGHHSEGRHRAALRRADYSARRALDAQHDAERASERAEAAAHTTGARYSVQTVANRIKTISADVRRAERRIEEDYYDPEHGYRPATADQKRARAERAAPILAELRDRLTYWEGVRAEQIATGKATNYGPDTINAGDSIKTRGHWRKVVRVNPKTVSVETGYSWHDRVDYAAIQAHQPATT